MRRTIRQWHDIVIRHYGGIDQFPDVITLRLKVERCQARDQELRELISVVLDYPDAATEDDLLGWVRERRYLLGLRTEMEKRIEELTA
jgi:hypothetical protein